MRRMHLFHCRAGRWAGQCIAVFGTRKRERSEKTWALSSCAHCWASPSFLQPGTCIGSTRAALVRAAVPGVAAAATARDNRTKPPDLPLHIRFAWVGKGPLLCRGPLRCFIPAGTAVRNLPFRRRDRQGAKNGVYKTAPARAGAAGMKVT